MIRKTILLPVLLMLLLLCCARAETAPECIILGETQVSIDMANARTHQLTASVLPAEADQTIVWTSSDRSVLTVEDGLITALKTGSCTVTAYVPGESTVFAQVNVTVTSSLLPTALTGLPERIALEPTQTLPLNVTVLPEGADSTLLWRTNNPSAISVDENNVLTAKREGSALLKVVSARDHSVSAQVIVIVKYKSAPDSVTLSQHEATLAVGETLSVDASTAPENASSIVRYKSTDTTVATVDDDGQITAVGYGQCEILAGSARDTRVQDRLMLTVTDERVPERIVVYPSPISLEPSQTQALDVVIFPQTLNAAIAYKSADASVASVSADGVVTAVGEGATDVFVYSVYTNKVFAKVPVQVKYGKAIQRLLLSSGELTLKRGDTAPLGITLYPEDASRALVYESSSPEVAYIDESGSIVAAMYGEATLRVRSYRDPSLYAEMKVTVADDHCPRTMTDAGKKERYVLRAGERLSVSLAFTPESADRSVVWISSDERIVSVSEDGAPVARSRGVATVRAQSALNSALYIDYAVTVEDDEYTLLMPARRTTVDEIDDNLAAIEKIRLCAHHALDELSAAGTIPAEEAVKRGEIVDEAFEMYAFPWMVTSVQAYWNDTNSEDGAKDFKPGVVYYGLPYMSSYNSFHTYSVKHALAEKKYVPVEGESYYLLNQEGKFTRNYAGNDCSSFVALAMFGYADYKNKDVKTDTLLKDDRLRAITDASTLRAGDILVRHNSHVIMFLYWADENRTQGVFIEQGGSEPAINTISASVYTISDYLDHFYRIRRIRGFREQ